MGCAPEIVSRPESPEKGGIEMLWGLHPWRVLRRDWAIIDPIDGISFSVTPSRGWSPRGQRLPDDVCSQRVSPASAVTHLGNLLQLLALAWRDDIVQENPLRPVQLLGVVDKLDFVEQKGASCRGKMAGRQERRGREGGKKGEGRSEGEKGRKERGGGKKGGRE
ncbi:hypothetical protein L345_18330, partial [Ophiophagus hannah]